MAADFGFIPVQTGKFYFVSYNSQDSARIASIAREMNNRNIPLWYDEGLLVGKKWEVQITEKIAACEAVILFLTKNLMQRENPYVQIEYGLAEEYHKTIYVIMLDEITFHDVTDDLKGWWIQLKKLHGIPVHNQFGSSNIVDCMEHHIRFIKSASTPSANPVYHQYTSAYHPDVHTQKEYIQNHNLSSSYTSTSQSYASPSNEDHFFQKNKKFILTASTVAVIFVIILSSVLLNRSQTDSNPNNALTGTSENTEDTEARDINLVVWSSESQQYVTMEACNEFVRSYADANSDVNSVTIDIQIVENDKVTNSVLNDLTAAADVFTVYPDIMYNGINYGGGIGSLVAAKCIYQLPNDIVSWMNGIMDSSVVKLGAYDGSYYGIPYSFPTYNIGDSYLYADVSSAYCYAVSAASREPEAAIELAMYLANESTQRIRYDSTGDIPTAKSVLNEVESSVNIKYLHSTEEVAALYN